MSKIIACCSCGNVPKFTETAFPTLFPGEKMPKIYEGINQIRKFAEKLPPDTNIAKYLLALARSKERYSYYFEYDDESGDVISQWNILKGRKVA